MKSAWTAVPLLVSCIVSSPTKARAEWLLTPAAAAVFGGDTLGGSRPVVGGSLTWRDDEAFGWEAGFAYSPRFFDGADTVGFDGAGHVIDVMANAVVGLPGGLADSRFTPYVTGGVGLMQMHVESENGLFGTYTHEPGFNVGAGLLALVTGRFGIRTDVRYVRSFQNQHPSWTRGTELDVAPGSFDFWRAGVGLSIRLAE